MLQAQFYPIGQLFLCFKTMGRNIDKLFLGRLAKSMALTWPFLRTVSIFFGNGPNGQFFFYNANRHLTLIEKG